MFLSLYPNHFGSVRLMPAATCASSIALAHFTKSASDQAVPISPSPNGMPESDAVPAGSVIIGYPACAATWPTATP